MKSKNNKIKSTKLTKEESLMENIWGAYICGKVNSPYLELMDYMGAVNTHGHNGFFEDISKREDVKLEDYIKTLTTILPEPLKTNLELAYKAYVNKTDCDSVYYENEELLNQILREKSKKMNLDLL